MSTDSLKLWFTYGTVVIVVVGGGVMIVLYGTTMDKLVVGAIIGFIGMALNFVFGAEVQTRTARQQERALLTSPSSGSGVTYTASTETGDVSVAPEAPTETKA